MKKILFLFSIACFLGIFIHLSVTQVEASEISEIDIENIEPSSYEKNQLVSTYLKC